MQNNNFYFKPFIPVRVELTEGIHMVKRQSVIAPSKDHYGVVVIGRPLEELGYFDGLPRVFHFTNEKIHDDLLPKYNNWNLVGSVHATQTRSAIMRLRLAYLNPNYNLFSNNCEHFARYITEGYKQSIQLQNAVVVGALAGLFIWAISE